MCFQIFTKKKYFNWTVLNDLITQFRHKGSDKANSVQAIPQNYTGCKLYENWALIWLLPLIVGLRVPEGDSAWQVLLTLKDILELVVAPVHTNESIVYLDFKISEHHDRFLEVFPKEILTTKYHFLEHYPALIEKYGPLVGVWTMHFKAKQLFKASCEAHEQFQKCVVAPFYKTSDDDGIPHAYRCGKTGVVCLKNIHNAFRCAAFDIQEALRETSPLLSSVQLANGVIYCGTRHTVGMILSYGSIGGLPDFAEIVQIAILDTCVHFIVKLLTAWYEEHPRSLQLLYVQLC